MTEIYDAWKVFGGVGVLAMLYYWGFIATGRELKQLQAELDQERKERETERAELRQELSFWREVAWSTSRTLDSVANSLPPKGTAK